MNKILTVLSLATVVMVAVLLGAPYANGSEQVEQVEEVEQAIDTLQPWFTRGNTGNRAAIRRNIARAIARAAEEHDIDPLIATAIARRESSLIPALGRGRIKGRNPKMRGFFQIYPDGVAERMCGTHNGIRCNQYNVHCNAQTALCFLSKIKHWCGDDPWLYVGGYGRSECPADRNEAMTWNEVVVARNFFCEVSDNCERVWPM
jgi:hypothetical protein